MTPTFDARYATSPAETAGTATAALRETISGSYEAQVDPQWDRGKLMVMARMAQPPAEIPNTPLRDEDVRRKED